MAEAEAVEATGADQTGTEYVVYSAGFQHAPSAQAQRPVAVAALLQQTLLDDAAWFRLRPGARARLRLYIRDEFWPAHSDAWLFVLVRDAVAGIRLREPLATSPLEQGHEPICLQLGADGETVLRQTGGMPQRNSYASPRQSRRRDTSVEE